MYSYAASSSAASTVTPFTAAPQVASPAASTTQAAAVTAATGTSIGSIQQQLNTAISQITAQLQSLAAPIYAPFQQEWNYIASSSGPLSWLWQILFGSSTFPSSSLSAFMSAYSPYAGVFYNTEGLPYFSIGMSNSMVQTAKSVGAIGGAVAPAAAAAVPKGLPGLGGLLGGAGPRYGFRPTVMARPPAAG